MFEKINLYFVIKNLIDKIVMLELIVGYLTLLPFIKSMLYSKVPDY